MLAPVVLVRLLYDCEIAASIELWWSLWVQSSHVFRVRQTMICFNWLFTLQSTLV